MKALTYGFEVSGEDVYFGIGNGSSWSAEPSMPLILGEWQYIAAVFDGSTITLYKDGAQVGSPVAATLSNSNRPLLIGSRTGSAEFFRGLIDEVRIYNRALTQTEIRRDMNTPPSHF